MRSAPSAFPFRRHFAGACLVALGLAPRLAAAGTSGATENSAPPSNYTDQGTVTNNYTVDRTGSWGGSYYGGYGNYWPSSGFSSYTVTTQYRPIYFPPVPPALGEPIPANVTRGSLAKFAPPSVLASYVYEPFYSPLSPLLFTEDLDRKRREKLDGYHTARTAALEALSRNPAPQVRALQDWLVPSETAPVAS